MSWETRTRRWALVFAALALLVGWLAAVPVIRAGRPAAATFMLASAPAVAVYAWRTAPIRRRRAILNRPFPPEWEAVLQRDVVFFRVSTRTSVRGSAPSAASSPAAARRSAATPRARAAAAGSSRSAVCRERGAGPAACASSPSIGPDRRVCATAQRSCAGTPDRTSRARLGDLGAP